MAETNLPAEIAAIYAQIPEVLAVVQGGSRTVGRNDAASDIDLYVYSREPVPLGPREAIAAARARRWEIGDHFAEEGDVWIEADTGTEIDVMFRPVQSFEDHVTYLLDRFEARQGNSTAIWQNILTSRTLFDREGWFAALQARATRPYPEGLAQAILALNVPLLSGAIYSRPSQVALGVRRGDLVVVNAQLALLMESYFDVLFALNRTLHPGAKRLVAVAATLPLVPANFERHIEQLLSFTSTTLPDVPARVEALVRPLLDLLDVHGQRPAPWGARA